MRQFFAVCRLLGATPNMAEYKAPPSGRKRPVHGAFWPSDPDGGFLCVFLIFLQYKKGESDERFDEGFYSAGLYSAFMSGR